MTVTTDVSTSDTTTRTPRERRRWLAEQRQNDNHWLGLALASGVAEAVALISQLGLMAWIIHALLTTDTRLSELTVRVSLLLLMILLRAGAQYLREIFSHQLSRRVRRRVRERLLAGWGRRGPVALSGRTAAGLSTALLEQVDALDGYYARYLPQAGLAVITPLLVFAVVLWLDWLAALFLLLSAPLIPLFMALVGMGAESLNQRHFTQLAWLSGHFTDRVRNLTTLRLFGQTRAAYQQIADASGQYRRLTMKTLRVAFLSSAVLEFFASVAIAVIAIYIGFGLLGYIEFGPSTELTLFSGLFALLLAPEFFQPLRLFAQHYHDRASALGAADHLIGHPEEAGQEGLIPRRSALHVHSDSPLLRARNVRFRYSGRAPLLQDVSFDVTEGEWLALTGPSGSGKTTLLRLIAGFMQPDSGTLKIRSEPPERFRFGWLDQHPFLAAGTWRDALTAGADTPLSDDGIYRALELVGLRTRIDTEPAGLDSRLHEQGYGLSGGQIRRLALARQFLAGHRLILLDEPTAGLDPDSEALILQVLDRLNQQGCTLIMVSHHEHSIQQAHRVMALQGGNLHAG